MGYIPVTFIYYPEFAGTDVRPLLHLQGVSQTRQAVFFSQVVDRIKGGVGQVIIPITAVLISRRLTSRSLGDFVCYCLVIICVFAADIIGCYFWYGLLIWCNRCFRLGRFFSGQNAFRVHEYCCDFGAGGCPLRIQPAA